MFDINLKEKQSFINVTNGVKHDKKILINYSPMPVAGRLGPLPVWGTALDPIATAGVGTEGAGSGLVWVTCTKRER